MTAKARRVNQLHREAMEFADESFVARLEKDCDQYLRLTRLAYEKEAAAAALMEDEKDIEPTRSVLYRSAATLAFRCEMYVEAKRLIHTALDGNPPGDIEYELKDLLDQVAAVLPDAMKPNGDFHATEAVVSKVGFVRSADVHDKSECKLITEAKETWIIHAPVSTMSEIVRRYFNRRVEVKGKQMKKERLVRHILLESPDHIRAV